jgi:hypothetical protein
MRVTDIGNGVPNFQVTGQSVFTRGSPNATARRLRGVDFGGAQRENYEGVFFNNVYDATGGPLAKKSRVIYGSNPDLDLEIQGSNDIRITAVDDGNPNGVNGGQVRIAAESSIRMHVGGPAETNNQIVEVELLGMNLTGNLNVSGTKSFVQPNPMDPSKAIRFVCLEGNESGTYFRGSSVLVNGQATIVVPQEFSMVTEEQGLTVQLTPRGQSTLWVESVNLNQIVVHGNKDVSFDYFVNGVRRGFANVDINIANEFFVPQYRGVPAFANMPEAWRQILVENGTLNPDFTPNEETYARQGWTLLDVVDTFQLHDNGRVNPISDIQQQ